MDRARAAAGRVAEAAAGRIRELDKDEMKTMKRTHSIGFGLSLLVAAFSVVGCGNDAEITEFPPAPSTEPAALGPFQYKNPVGVPVTASNDPAMIANLASRVQPSRMDPFALLGTELRFDLSQRGERLLETTGNWSTMFEPPVEVDESLQDVMEPQPYRRLAGVLVSDTVSAIIIMENGNAHLIRPGTMIPNSPWRVVSIDEEKAVLRRAGNRKPTQIIVRLENPPGGGGFNPGTGGGRPAGGGPPAGGRGRGGPDGDDR